MGLTTFYVPTLYKNPKHRYLSESSQELCGIGITVILIYTWGIFGPERLRHLPWITQLAAAELASRPRWSEFQGFVFRPQLYCSQASSLDSLPSLHPLSQSLFHLISATAWVSDFWNPI